MVSPTHTEHFFKVESTLVLAPKKLGNMQATFAKTRDQRALQIEALQCHGIVSWRHCTLVAALEATEFFTLIFSGDAKKV